MVEAMKFAPAKRKASWFRGAMVGASGSGKTYSAIRVARGLVGPDGRIAVVDTENGSASLYEGLGKTKVQPTGFDVLELGPPWSVPRYEASIKLAVVEKYDAVILDQVSWLWEGDGGLLESLDAFAKATRSGSTFDAWKKVTPMYWDFIRAILLAPIHVIVLMRAKVEWEIQKTDQGKAKPVKIGMKPIQREGFDYEMTVVWNLSAEHGADISKDRTNLFKDRPPTPLDEAVGKTIREWLSSGEAPTIEESAAALLPEGTPVEKKKAAVPAKKAVEDAETQDPEMLDKADRMKIVSFAKEAELDPGEVLTLASEVCGTQILSTADIPKAKLEQILDRIAGAV